MTTGGFYFPITGSTPEKKTLWNFFWFRTIAFLFILGISWFVAGWASATLRHIPSEPAFVNEQCFDLEDLEVKLQEPSTSTFTVDDLETKFHTTIDLESPYQQEMLRFEGTLVSFITASSITKMKLAIQDTDYTFALGSCGFSRSELYWYLLEEELRPGFQVAVNVYPEDLKEGIFQIACFENVHVLADNYIPESPWMELSNVKSEWELWWECFFEEVYKYGRSVMVFR